MPEIIATKYLVGGSLCLFGGLVHIAKHQISKKAQLSIIDAMALYLTAVFSGVTFGLTALLMSDLALHMYLAVCIGSFLGIAGLSKISDMIVGILTK